MAAAAALLLGLLLAVGAGWYALRMQVPDPPPAEPGSPSGLVGWMILPAIGTVVSPFMMLAALWECRELMQQAAFTGLGAGSAGAFGALTPKLLLLTSIVAITALVGVSLANILHLHRRHKAYPRLFVIVQWASIGASVLMLAFAGLIVVPGGEGTVQQATIALFRDALMAAIWTAYMRRSRRVRATFRGESPHPQAQPAASPPVGAPDPAGSWASPTGSVAPPPVADAG